MTVSTTTSRISYSGNGSTTAFAVPYYFLADADLLVISTSAAGLESTLVLSTDYTVSGAGVSTGGTVTFTTAPASGTAVTIIRDPSLTQATDYQANDPFPAETHERALDKLTMIAQRLSDVNDRSLHLSDGDTTTASLELPSPQANYLLGWNENATALQNFDGSTLATIVAYGTSNADVFNGDGTSTAFTLSSNPGAQNNLDVAIGGVTQRPGIDYTWTSGTTITFTTAPPSGTQNVLVRYMQGLPQTSANASSVTYNPAGTSAVQTSVQSKLRETISVKDFGAKGDGVTDDTAAIQAALDSGASNGAFVILPAGTYKITTVLNISNGLRGFIGQGGNVLASNSNSWMKLAGKNSGKTSNVSFCVIDGIKFNANSIASAALVCENINNCIIKNNYFYNLPFSNANGIILRSFAAGLADSYFNIVSNNNISGTAATTGSAGGCGIGIDVLNAELNYGATGTTTPTAYWKATFTAADATYKGHNNIISDNVIYGSYYGISLSAATYNTITGNNTSNNIRGMSIQNCSNANQITGNTIFENESSGIHLAYGSSNNNIDGNTIYSTLAVGEGQLQAYVGCQSNKFSNNKVTIGGAGSPQFLMYCGCMSGGNEFINNTLTGVVSKAMIGVESTWNTATTNPASRAYSNPAVGSGWANAGMSTVSIIGNTISAASATAPAIFFYQVTESATCSLVNCRIQNNRIVTANQNYQLQLSEDTSGNLTNFILLNNDFYFNQNIPGAFSLARGRAHFVKCMNNTIFNDWSLGYQFPSGTTVLDVATLDIASTAAYSSATTITNFTGGMAGQTLLVRLSVYTTIQNNANILLKGGVNAVGSSSNQYITLFNTTGSIWVEISRNF